VFAIKSACEFPFQLAAKHGALRNKAIAIDRG
jgi:hypothetical protein